MTRQDMMVGRTKCFRCAFGVCVIVIFLQMLRSTVTGTKAFGKVIDEVAGETGLKSIGGYFYEEIPRITNPQRRRIFPCTSLEVCKYKRVMRKWLNVTRLHRSTRQ